jgi:hypothetical protein
MNDHQEAEIPRVRLAWGRRGAHDAAERGDILVVVDTLRFSTAAVTAVHHGALIYPCATDEALYNALAQRVGGEVARIKSRVDVTRTTAVRLLVALHLVTYSCPNQFHLPKRNRTLANPVMVCGQRHAQMHAPILNALQSSNQLAISRSIHDHQITRSKSR